MNTPWGTKLISGQIFTNLSSQIAADVEICRKINARLEKQEKHRHYWKKSEKSGDKVKEGRGLIINVNNHMRTEKE